MNNKLYLLTTTDHQKYGSHDIIIHSVKKHEENLCNHKLYLYKIYNRHKIKHILCYITYLFTSFLQGKLFGARLASMNYKKIRVGKYAIASALRKRSSVTSKLYYYYHLIIKLYIGINRIEEFLLIKNNIQAIYIDNPMYMNGVYNDLSILFNIPLYHNNYPYNLTRFSGAKKTNMSDYFLVHPKISVIEQNKGEKIYYSILNNNNIDYMREIKYVDCINGICFKDVYAVVYAHSFSDGQQNYYGDIAFRGVYDWLMYTIKILKNKKIIIKSHPNIYKTNTINTAVKYDKEIWKCITKELQTKPNIQIIDEPIYNKMLLSKLDKETILVSHHGNSLIEGGGLGFKCICHKSSPWDKYNLFNKWETKKQYNKLLLNVDKLQVTSKEKIYIYVSNLYGNENSYFSDKHFLKIMSKELNIKYSTIKNNIMILNNINSEKKIQMINKIAKNIQELKITYDRNKK